MGDSRDSFTKLEQNETKTQTTSAPDLLGNSMSSRESLDVVRAGNSKASSNYDFLPASTDLLYQFDGSPVKQSHKSAQQFSGAVSGKDVYQFDGSPVNKDVYTFDGSFVDKNVYKFDGNFSNTNFNTGEKSHKDSSPEHKKCYVQHHEKAGKLDLTIDARGELFGLKDAHHTFRKFGDEWFEDLDGGKTSKKIAKVEAHKDGSYSFTNENGKYSYDNKGQLVEAPAGDGHSRKFHYDSNGQVDQIDGRLGHWDRQVINGHVSWKNADGRVWNGDFKVTEDGLQFNGDNGISWGFTAQGKDLRLKPTDK